MFFLSVDPTKFIKDFLQFLMAQRMLVFSTQHFFSAASDEISKIIENNKFSPKYHIFVYFPENPEMQLYPGGSSNFSIRGPVLTRFFRLFYLIYIEEPKNSCCHNRRRGTTPATSCMVRLKLKARFSPGFHFTSLRAYTSS